MSYNIKKKNLKKKKKQPSNHTTIKDGLLSLNFNDYPQLCLLSTPLGYKTDAQSPM